MAGRRGLAILPSSLRCLTSVAFQPAELQGVYNFGAKSGIVQPGEIGEVSGVPDAHLHRKAKESRQLWALIKKRGKKGEWIWAVVIYSPARVASQQGAGKTGQWKICFESTQKWENPLMGWTSTGDPYHAVGEAALVFETKEAAMEFANKYGWQIMVREPHQRAIRTQAYADNFKWKGPAEEQ